MGRVRGQQRGTQDSWRRARRSDFDGTSTWTSQLFVLADYYNVQAAIPDFAEQYTANKIKYATTPAALAGFQHLQEGIRQGLVAEGLRLCEVRRRPEHARRRRYRAVPDAELRARHHRHESPRQDQGHRLLRTAGHRCREEWRDHLDARGNLHPQDIQEHRCGQGLPGVHRLGRRCSRHDRSCRPGRSVLIKGAALPADTLPAVLDIQAYVDAGKTAPALEFVSPVKGPKLEQITVAVGSGLTTAEDGAAQYDEDVKAQAKQLNLPGW